MLGGRLAAVIASTQATAWLLRSRMGSKVESKAESGVHEALQ